MRLLCRVLIAGLGILVFLAVGCGVLLWVGLENSSGPFRESVEIPGQDFESATKLRWPASARVVQVGDTHGGFHGDGEFFVVFDVDRVTIDRWLAASPPWGTTWQAGPVPNEIASHCWFGATGQGIPGDRQGVQGDLDQALVEIVMNDKSTRYVARDRSPQSIPWHNGQLLVLDPARNRVWLSVWDF